MKYYVDFLRLGSDERIIFETRADAETFVNWGQGAGPAFILATITEVPE